MIIRKIYDGMNIDFDSNVEGSEYKYKIHDFASSYLIVTDDINNIIKLNKDCKELYKRFMADTNNMTRPSQGMETFYYYNNDIDDYKVDITFFAPCNELYSFGLLKGSRFKYMVDFLDMVVDKLYNDIDLIKEMDIKSLLQLKSNGGNDE